MPKIGSDEREIMEWASRAFKKPWFDLCDLLARLHEGEKVPWKESLLKQFFIPASIPGPALYRAMKLGATKAALGSNPNMLTVVLNKKGDAIVWSCIERAEDGVYTECHELNDRLDEDWAKEAARLLYEDRLDQAFDYLKDWLTKQPDLKHIELGLIKVAHLQFFGALKRAWEEADDGKKLVLMGVKMADAVREIMEEGWLRFYPNVNLRKVLKTIAPALEAMTPLNKGLQKGLEKLPV